jgi:ABC-2 type transport system permease protein
VDSIAVIQIRSVFMKLNYKTQMILAIVIAVAMLIAGGIFNLSGYIDYEEYYENTEYYQDEIEYQKEMKANSMGTIAGLAEELESTEDAGLLYDELSYYNSILYDIVYFELCIEKDVGRTLYLQDCAANVADVKSTEQFCEYYETLIEKNPRIEDAFSEAGLDISDIVYIDEVSEDDISEYTAILSARDYGRYIALENKLIREDTSLSETSKELAIKANEMKLEINPDGEAVSEEIRAQEEGIDEYVFYKTLIIEGRNDVGGIITPERLEQYSRTANELELAMKVGAVGLCEDKSVEEEFTSQSMIDVGFGIAAIAVLLFAATIISDEIQSGSIKTLIIAPVKRSKIFVAKVLSVVTVAVVYAVVVIVSFLLWNTVLGLGSAPVVFTDAFNNAASMSYYSYIMSSVGLRVAELLVYAIFAVMLSTLFRNSSVSIVVTLIEYFLVKSIVNTMVMMNRGISFTVMSWFLPETNICLADKVFRQSYTGFSVSLDLETSLFSSGNPGVWFSVAYTVVLVSVLFYIGFDSFCRRDIK